MVRMGSPVRSIRGPARAVHEAVSVQWLGESTGSATTSITWRCVPTPCWALPGRRSSPGLTELTVVRSRRAPDPGSALPEEETENVRHGRDRAPLEAQEERDDQ